MQRCCFQLRYEIIDHWDGFFIACTDESWFVLICFAGDKKKYIYIFWALAIAVMNETECKVTKPNRWSQINFAAPKKKNFAVKAT